MALFKKKTVVGVSLNPEFGLEVAQVDFSTKTVLKYGRTSVAYDNNRKEIADMDTFKVALSDLLTEVGIPKGTALALNFPSIAFRVVDYPASLEEAQIMGVIEEDLLSNPLFQNNDPLIGAVALPNSTIQFRKVAYTALQKSGIIELVMHLKENGYLVHSIDTSVNTTLNALIYNDRVSTSPDSTWVMVQVDNGYARTIAMQGQSYVESHEERISIGAVLGDEENYSTVISAIQPYLEKLPADRLLVISKTDVISAKILANQLRFNGQILYEEANSCSKEPFLAVAPTIDEGLANEISIDVIGAAINADFAQYSVAPINLYNNSLGAIYDDDQPWTITIGGRTYVFSIENCIVATIVTVLLILAIAAAFYVPALTEEKAINAKLQTVNAEITEIERFLKEHDWVSSSVFNESDEIKMGLNRNKSIYSYYTVVGTEIPKKLWLTALDLGDVVSIKGQADNVESIYSFLKNLNDYDAGSRLSLQKLVTASNSSLTELTDNGEIDAETLMNTMEANFYEFEVSNGVTPEPSNDLPGILDASALN